MFNDSKYTKTYFQIIERAKSRKLEGYTETHHIIPSSMVGSNDDENLVELTGKEHFIVHHLLTKMCVKERDMGMLWTAFFRMHQSPSKNSDRIYTARTYEMAKVKMAEHKSKYYRGKNNHYYGKKHSTQVRKRMRKNWNRDADRNVDKTIYTFVHEEHGIKKCTRKELCREYDLNQKLIYQLVKRKVNSSQGWRIVWENEAMVHSRG